MLVQPLSTLHCHQTLLGLGAFGWYNRECCAAGFYDSSRSCRKCRDLLVSATTSPKYSILSIERRNKPRFQGLTRVTVSVGICRGNQARARSMNIEETLPSKVILISSVRTVSWLVLVLRGVERTRQDSSIGHVEPRCGVDQRRLRWSSEDKPAKKVRRMIATPSGYQASCCISAVQSVAFKEKTPCISSTGTRFRRVLRCWWICGPWS